jgi:hypothetical protein
MKTNRISVYLMLIGLALLSAGSSWAQDVLPFPDLPMGGKVGPTMRSRSTSGARLRATCRRTPQTS